MKVLLVNGSPRKNGDTFYSLGIIEKVLNEAGARVPPDLES